MALAYRKKKRKKIYNVGRAFILLKGLLFKPAVEFNDTAVSFPTRLVKSLNTDRNSKIGKMVSLVLPCLMLPKSVLTQISMRFKK